MKTTNEQLSYALLRITMGAAMMGHGLVRIPKLEVFAGGMVKMFDGVLPAALVTPFAHVLPFLEFIIGALLILGWLTRATLVVGAVLMMVLILGSCLLEKWEFVGTQLVYSFLYFVLLRFLAFNAYALDNGIKKQ
ncbi:DoxX family protein [Chitinophaga parva]|uniref:DoxX family protein n=1 Tax=Chitinophaga parva TaxID=2169414 RepID=A0A2T7BG16_9BACT|nr:DoxX family membrane protein [Chitinophaga parva]PUZ25173.1 DoxX family protein [Chitinophaga parva]